MGEREECRAISARTVSPSKNFSGQPFLKIQSFLLEITVFTLFGAQIFLDSVHKDQERMTGRFGGG
jgi:hypothetical protein